MNKLPSPLTEFILGFILVALLAVIFNTPQMYMSDMTTMFVALLLILLFGLFSLFILRERPQDEREELLVIKSSRIAFLITGATLVLGIVIQLIQHDVDLWLLIVFSVMILAKLFGYLYVKDKY